MRLFRDIKKYWKYMIYAAKADLVSEVTNAYLDWFWWVLEPVLNMLIYYIVFGIVFHSEERYYMVFIYSALTMWSFFSKCSTTSVNLVRDSRDIVSRVYIPKQILVIRKMFVNAFKMLISCGIVLILMLLYRVPVDYHILGLVPVMIVFFIFTYGICCLLLHFGVFVEDLSYIVSIVLNMLFFFTGIFYTVETAVPDPFGYLLLNANPLAFLIAHMRNALMYQNSVSFKGLLVWGCISILIAGYGTWLVYKNENSYVKVI